MHCSDLRSALSAVDKDELAAALHQLEQACSGASDDQLLALHRAGHLPAGIHYWLAAKRKESEGA